MLDEVRQNQCRRSLPFVLDVYSEWAPQSQDTGHCDPQHRATTQTRGTPPRVVNVSLAEEAEWLRSMECALVKWELQATDVRVQMWKNKTPKKGADDSRGVRMTR